MFKQLFLACVLGLALLASGAASAAPRVDIYGPGQNLVSLGLAAPITGPNVEARGNGAKLQALVNENLSFLPFIKLTDPKTVLGAEEEELRQGRKEKSEEHRAPQRERAVLRTEDRQSLASVR